jgi:hypothetical protein
MTALQPPVWRTDQLELSRQRSIEAFRRERVDEPLEQYLGFYHEARDAVEHLLEVTGDLAELRGQAPQILADPAFLHVARYLASPPISVDDLITLADTTLAPHCWPRSRPVLSGLSTSSCVAWTANASRG